MTDKLKVFVCSGFKDYFENIALKEFEDLEVCSFPTMCGLPSGEAKKLSGLCKNLTDNPEDAAIVCGSLCPAMKVLSENSRKRAQTQDICFSHIIGKGFTEYLTSKGDYLITERWLCNWRENIKAMGFGRELARQFYGEWARQIVCVSQGKKIENVANLEELSKFLNLPFMVVEADSVYIKILLHNLLAEWRLRKAREKNDSKIASFRKQSADYMTMLELIKDLTHKEKESEVTETVKSSLSMLFSCGTVDYFSALRNSNDILDDKVAMFLRTGQQYSLLDNNIGFMLRVEHAGLIEGVFVFSGFQFPSYISSYLSFCLNISSVVGLAISNSRRIEIIKKNESEMEYIGTHDGLTGIFNRRFFDDKLKELQQKQIDEGLCILVCDLDDLKIINDVKGHDVGDEAIKAAVGVLKESLRFGDILARMGGDEFVAILPGYPQSALGDLSERILKNLEKYNQSSKEFTLNFSFGVAHGFTSEDNLLELVKRADEIMYERKMEKKARKKKIVVE